MSGALMALIALVAGVKSWSVQPWIWLTASSILVGWAVLKVFHDVKSERDDALRESIDARDHEAIANTLTKEHHYGVHNLLHADVGHSEWDRWVRNWNEGVAERMKELQVSQPDIDRFVTIKSTDLPVKSGLPTEVAFVMHSLRLERLRETLAKHQKIAEDIRLRRN